jgi:hypothetical protein
VTPKEFSARFPALKQPLSGDDLWYSLRDELDRWICIACGQSIEPGDDIYWKCAHMLDRRHPLYRSLRTDVRQGETRGHTMREHMEDAFCPWLVKIHCQCETRALFPGRAAN